MGGGQRRVERDGLPHVRLGGVRLVQVGQGVAEIEVRLRVARRRRHRVRQRRRRLVRAVQGVQGGATQELHLRQRPVRRQRRQEVECGGGLLSGDQGAGEGLALAQVTGPQLHGLAQRRHRLRRPSGRQQGGAEQEQRARLLRIVRQDLTEQRLRLRQLPGALVGDGIQQRSDGIEHRGAFDRDERQGSRAGLTDGEC